MTRLVDGQIGDAFWAALVAAVLHPVEVEIVEAMRWICLPLTATDLLYVFEARRSGLRIERRLWRLGRLGAIASENNGMARGPLAQLRYRLVEEPRPRL
jgi:hypothetical protein